jgi:SAM-dependent methyltransferase
MPDRLEWADDPALVAFYESHRDRPADLYPSERRFLPWLARRADSVLDAGCATGGFLNIWRHFNPDVRYLGVDLSAALIESARRLHPAVEFEVGDCASGLPFGERSFDAVQALGWLHWERRYRAALAELWRVTGRSLFFDIRLTDADADLDSGTQLLTFSAPDNGRQTASTPYICVSWAGLADLIKDLRPARVLAYGYWGAPAETVSGVSERVCFATFVLERAPASASGTSAAALELPLPWPDAWAGEFVALPAGWLGKNVSEDGS